MECLQNIFGITPEPCECLVGYADPEDDYTTSVSGLYLEDVKDIPQLSAFKDMSQCRTLYQALTAAKNSAVKSYTDDLLMEIAQIYKRNKDFYVGSIGQATFTASMPPYRPFAGQRWRSLGSVDGVVKIKKIQVMVDGNITSELKLYRTPEGHRTLEETELVLTLPFIAVANTITNVPLPGNLPIKIPLSNRGIAFDYWWSYDLKGSNPKNTKAICSTCSYYAPLRKFLEPFGADYLGDGIIAGVTTNTQGSGLAFDVEVRCDNESFFCREYRDDEPIAVATAHAIRYRAADNLLTDLLMSNEISRYTMSNRDYLFSVRNMYRSEYEKRLRWIALNIDTNSSDCFICRGTQGIQFGGILT